MDHQFYTNLSTRAHTVIKVKKGQRKYYEIHINTSIFTADLNLYINLVYLYLDNLAVAEIMPPYQTHKQINVCLVLV